MATPFSSKTRSASSSAGPRPSTGSSTSVGLINPRHILAGLVLGILLTIASTSVSLHSLAARLGLSTPPSADHLSWRTWHTVQLNTPFVPNHDPNDLGHPPPEDLVSRRPSKKKAEPGSPPMKMVLPKKLDLHRSDEL